MVGERGMKALSVRSLASAAGTSTTAVYALFGSKPALLGALFEESFTSFGAAQFAVPLVGDPETDLTALGHAYWTWARQHPHLYQVMFGETLAGFEPTPAQAAVAESTIEPLAGVVRAAVAAGLMTGDPPVITFAIWAIVHGVVSLVMAGRAPGDEAVAAPLFEAAAQGMVRGWLTGSAQPHPHRDLDEAVERAPGPVRGQPGLR